VLWRNIKERTWNVSKCNQSDNIKQARILPHTSIYVIHTLYHHYRKNPLNQWHYTQYNIILYIVYNGGQKSLGHIHNVTNYLCFTTEVWKSAAILLKTVAVPLPHPIQCLNQVKLQVLVFNIVCGVGGEVRQVKVYLCLACGQKCQKCKFVPRLLSMIVWISVEK